MTRPSTSMTQAWLCVALLWFVACLNYLDRIMLTTMRSSITEAIPMSDAQFGLLTSVFLWVYGALSPFAGFLADRFGRSRVIVGSLFAWSAITWLTGHAKTFDQLLFARALMGISEACYIPAGMALIMDYHRGPTRSLANGIHVSGVFVGSGLGGLGGWLAERHEWGYAFKLFGIVGVIYSVLLIFILRDLSGEMSAAKGPMAGAKPGFISAIKSLFSSGSFFIALIYWGLLGLAGWGVNGWMPTYFKEQFNLSQGAAGFSATGYLQAAALVGVIVGGILTDRWSRSGERRRITITLIAILLAAPGILLAANTGLITVAVVGLMLYGLMRSLADVNMMPILCLVSDSRYRATGYGILNMFACFVGGITIYAGGALRDAQVDVSRIFQLSAAGLIVAAVLLFFVKPNPSGNTDEPVISSLKHTEIAS
ncbi:MAG: transporter [Pedosphaera sp.]|nr:transporter [Pedosphaera sp.]